MTIARMFLFTAHNFLKTLWLKFLLTNKKINADVGELL